VSRQKARVPLASDQSGGFSQAFASSFGQVQAEQCARVSCRTWARAVTGWVLRSQLRARNVAGPDTGRKGAAGFPEL
jgi:hypothetical protein